MSEVQFAQASAIQIPNASLINAACQKRIIIVPNRVTLLTKSYYARLALATANLKLPRRKIPNWMTDCLYRDDVEFRFSNGSIYKVGDEDIEDSFGGDLSFRWLSDFIQSAGTQPKQRPHYTLEDRMRLLALSFWVDNPDVAQQFAEPLGYSS